eukprot:CAMPEP_0195117988 /NCGR_PEP_ID=MMETSP0448-20130528/115810_1 /TAXON_ID=66468 /ORGANISM="Heterocapsa triquestra, Strain CCMP 448" /LENGTH=67 /DNA_ID=CAMNT_0040155237 /DNA_START=28 /DNA_END=228 /DNA_ORIENTATION=+
MSLKAAQGQVEHFNMKELMAIYKGPEFTEKVPHLAHLAAVCVGADFNRRLVLFHFKDTVERDQFFTC